MAVAPAATATLLLTRMQTANKRIANTLAITLAMLLMLPLLLMCLDITNPSQQRNYCLARFGAQMAVMDRLASPLSYCVLPHPSPSC